MKKILLPILLFAFSYPLQAQWERKSKAGLGAGYELNVFLNPSSLQTADGLLDRSDLWQNGSYQSIFSSNSFKRDYGKYTLKFKVNGSASLYQTEMDANRYAFDLAFSYRRKYAKRKYFEFAPEFTRKKRDGLNQADAILQTPFSYLQAIIPLKFDFYLRNKVWLKTTVGYRYKQYDQPNEGELFYHSPFSSLSLSKKWKNERNTKKLTVSGEVQLRTYTDIDAINLDEGTFDEETRNWNFFKNDVEFSFAPEKNGIEWTVGLYHLTRIDLNETNTYRQLTPGVQASYRSGKWHTAASLRYSIRNYENLSPGRGNDLLLRYTYLRSQLRVDYNISKNSLLYVKANLINRTSNNPTIDRLGFRGYLNGYIESGIQLKF